MPWLVVLDGKGYISRCKGIKREFKIFLQIIFRGTVLISKVFWKTIPYFLLSLWTQMYFCCGENLATIRNMSTFTGYTTLSNTINDCFLVEEELLSHSHNK